MNSQPPASTFAVAAAATAIIVAPDSIRGEAVVNGKRPLTTPSRQAALAPFTDTLDKQSPTAEKGAQICRRKPNQDRFVTIRALALLLALVAPFTSAMAQHPLVLERLKAWNDAAPTPSMDVLEAEVRRKAETIYQGNDTCPSSSVSIDAVTPATADRHMFNALIRGTMRNAWFVNTRTPGCDEAPVRYMIMQDAESSFRTIRVNRGMSHAWESLLGDTLRSVQLAATAALKREGVTCGEDARTSLGVTRIALEGPDLGQETYGIRYSGSWSEIWPIEACGRVVEVSIAFTADGDGGAFTSIPGEQTRVLP